MSARGYSHTHAAVRLTTDYYTQAAERTYIEKSGDREEKRNERERKRKKERTRTGRERES